MITYEVEPFNIAWPEMEKLFPLHYKEIALDQDRIKLKPDVRRYKAMADAAMFHIMTMRFEGCVIGYQAAFMYPHFHYSDDLMAYTDIYFVLPEFRKGRNGIKLFTEFEKSLKKRGCVKIFTGTKIHAHLDHSKILERLGYKFVEKLYSKYIG